MQGQKIKKRVHHEEPPKSSSSSLSSLTTVQFRLWSAIFWSGSGSVKSLWKLGLGLKLPRLPLAKTRDATSIPLAVRNDPAENVRSVLPDIELELAPDTSLIVEEEDIEPSLALLIELGCLWGDLGGSPRPMPPPYPNPDFGPVVASREGCGKPVDDEAVAGVLCLLEESCAGALAWLFSATLVCKGCRALVLTTCEVDAKGVVNPIPRLRPAGADAGPNLAGVGVIPRCELVVLDPNFTRFALALDAGAIACFWPVVGAGVIPRGGTVDLGRCAASSLRCLRCSQRALLTGLDSGSDLGALIVSRKRTSLMVNCAPFACSHANIAGRNSLSSCKTKKISLQQSSRDEGGATSPWAYHD